jgi:hypothetical protein
LQKSLKSKRRLFCFWKIETRFLRDALLQIEDLEKEFLENLEEGEEQDFDFGIDESLKIDDSGFENLLD